MYYKNLTPSKFELIPKGEKINAQILEIENRNDLKVYVFSEKENSYTCLLSVNNTTNKLPKINGLTIEYQFFGEPGLEKNSYIFIECHTSTYLNNYCEILKEILELYDNSEIQLVEIINRVISKWRYFLGEPKDDILSEDNIIGLIGELIFLKELLKTQAAFALTIWKADKGEEDFINSQKVLEVKTTIKSKHEHIINGIDQLLINPEKQKFILSILLNKSKSESSFSLPSIINICTDLIENDRENLDNFYKKLKNRGYDSRDHKSYLDYTYDYYRGAYFAINHSFPKLTTQELISPLNSRISKVRYTLDLEGLDSRDFLTTAIKDII